MYAVEFLEYNLELSTGERIQVSELDESRYPPLSDKVVLLTAAAVVVHCTHAARDVVEDAKSGLPERLEDFIRTPPEGCLMKLESPVCSEISQCAIANRSHCTTRYRTKASGAAFPFCWTYSVKAYGSPEQKAQGQDLCDSIVDAWRGGRLVVIVRG